MPAGSPSAMATRGNTADLAVHRISVFLTSAFIDF
jgi:hypothetical protein